MPTTDFKKTVYYNPVKLSTLQWIEILLNGDITSSMNLNIFQALYGFAKYESCASQIAKMFNIKYQSLNFEVGRYAKRIAEHYDIGLEKREELPNHKFWPLFFEGYKDVKFIWRLRPEIIEALIQTGLTGDIRYPEEIHIEIPNNLLEGMKRTIIVNSYERNAKARHLCVAHWKAICQVCSFDFEKKYGDIGAGYIHVHHIVPISKIEITYEVDPIKDLVPVCPNCHAMLHTSDPPLSILELKSRLNL